MSKEPIYPLEEKSCVHTRSINQRLVPKRRMMTVTIPLPVVCNTSESYSESSIVEFKTVEDSKAFVEAIRKAMEGKS